MYTTLTHYYAVRYMRWEYEPLWASLHACCSPNVLYCTMRIYNTTVLYDYTIHCTIRRYNTTVLCDYTIQLYYTTIQYNCTIPPYNITLLYNYTLQLHIYTTVQCSCIYNCTIQLYYTTIQQHRIMPQFMLQSPMQPRIQMSKTCKTCKT